MAPPGHVPGHRSLSPTPAPPAREESPTNTALQLLGAGLVLLALVDIFLTVLYPGSGHGPIRRPSARAIWASFRLVARPLPPDRRPGLLGYVGPTLVLASIVGWFALLAIGWALVYLPALGQGVQASSGSTPQGFFAALYYSTYTLSTLGLGDLAPTNDVVRMLTVVESTTGFAVLTLVVTYFLNVYSALPTRNAFGQSLHHLSRGGSGDPVALLAGLAADGPDQVRATLSSAADSLRAIEQTHHAYPVLAFFQPRQESHYALPRMLLTILEVAALTRTALDPETFGRLEESATVHELEAAGRGFLAHLAPEGARAPSTTQQQTWREHHREVRRRLAERGVAVREDDEAGEEYLRLRAAWDAPLAALAEERLFEWGDDGHPAPGR